MKNLFYGICFLGLTGLASCGGSTSPADQLTANDFESLDGWAGTGVTPSLTKEKAHSGVYCIKVDPAIDYSMGFTNQLGRISPGKLKKIKLHAWVFVPNDKGAGVLVTEIKTAGQPKNLWDGFDLMKEAKAKNGLNKWLEVEHTVDVPETAVFSSLLQVYLWRSGSSQPTYLDDLQILKVE